jgi:hypothetical protein
MEAAMPNPITGLSDRSMNDLRKKANEVVTRFDADRNGRIDKAEGAPLISHKDSSVSSSRDWLTGDFVTVTTVTYDVLKSIRSGDAKLADLNGDGLDADEIVNAVLREADKNGNGTLDKGFLSLFGNERLSATPGKIDSKFVDTTHRETGRSSYTYYSPLPRENDRPTPPSTGGDYRPTPPSTGGSSRPTPPSTGDSSRPTPPSTR